MESDARPGKNAPVLPVIAKGKGAVITDVDGNDYVDFGLNQGAIILGHADDRVVAAISKWASKGFGFSDPTEAQVRLAEMIAGRFASVDQVFFTRSRARALATAIRVARAATGRPHVLVARGSVAAQIAWAIDAGSTILEGDYDVRRPDASGHARTLTVEPGDAAEWQRVFTENASTVAAVVIEPFGVSTGLCEPDAAGMSALRSLCSEHGAFLVFDDCVTGLRAGSGGAEGVLGLIPDMVLLGAEIGGGLPLAALGGHKDVMKEAADIAGHSIFGDAPADDLAVAAGTAVMQAIAEDGFYETLNEQAVRFADGLGALQFPQGAALDVRRVGSLVSFASGNDTVTQWGDSFDALLAAKIMPPCNARAPWAVSAAHTKDDIDRTLNGLAVVLNAFARQS